MNSDQLLEGTDLVLFNINEATLTKWYKDTTHLDEVRQLLQGKNLPGNSMENTSNSLPNARTKLPIRTAPIEPFVFEEHEDTTGEAVFRTERKKSGKHSCTRFIL